MVDPGGNQVSWCLECVSAGWRSWEVAVSAPRFRVGRQPGLDLTLNSAAVSKAHADLSPDGEALLLEDLGSRNGTFVNGERVERARLLEGDIVGFADVEFRVGRVALGRERQQATGPLETIRPPVQALESLRGLIRGRHVRTFFQPIHDLATGAVIGHEALGRGGVPGLPEHPTELFDLACWAGLEAELSRAFRDRAALDATGLAGGGLLLLNTHPSEVDRAGLLDSVARVREALPGTPLVVELHERALPAPRDVGTLKADLGRLGVELAFDDFGAGQARLLELAEAPPHYLKFDTCFVHLVDRAPAARLRLLRSLLELADDMGVHTVAEGVETPAEARVCRDLGFRSAQGYHFGRPAPLAHPG